MEGKRLIEKIRLRNILSFGDKGEEITLEPLNIIIGQNASGKSNLVDVIKLLGSLPQDKGLVNFISKSGGISEWIWKGERENILAEFYGKGFKINALPKTKNVEKIAKSDIDSGLKNAVRLTSKKEYKKGEHAGEILRIIDSKKVRAAAPHCEKLFDSISEKSVNK
jgi:predicted ATPase